MDVRATAIINAGERLGALGDLRRFARSISALERLLLTGLADRALGWPQPHEAESTQGAGPRYLN